MAEAIAFENGRISNFQRLVTLTSDEVIMHAVVHHSLTSTYMLNFEDTFCGRTYVGTHGLTFKTKFVRSTQKSQPNKEESKQQHIITRCCRVLPSTLTFVFDRRCRLSSSESDSCCGFDVSGLDFCTKNHAFICSCSVNVANKYTHTQIKQETKTAFNIISTYHQKGEYVM